MIFYLRNKRNETILDVELFKDEKNIELRSVVCIAPYSKLLLDIFEDSSTKGMRFIHTFDSMQELRGWLWEVYFMGRQNELDEFDKVRTEVENILSKVCEEFPELHIVTD